jgi:hypothetical protein
MASAKKILNVLNALTTMPEPAAESLDAVSNTRAGIQDIIDSKNVLAVGISEKISKKKKTGKLALIFYVEKKIPMTRLKKKEIVPETVPSRSGGEAVITDVIAIGKLKPELNISRKSFQPGFSIGHVKGDAGTFGAVVKDKKNQLYILSNSHVLANCGKCNVGDLILYPGVFDKGVKPADVRARLHSFVPFNINEKYGNVVDCALAKPTDEQLINMLSEIKGFGLPKGVAKPKRGMKVVKVGRTTGKTSSEITDVNFRTIIDFRKKGLRKVGFKDQIWCEKHYTKPGDSGSLVIEKATGKAVGLHFAGAEGGSAHNPIDKVLSALQVKLVTTNLAKQTLKKKKKAAKKKP